MHKAISKAQKKRNEAKAALRFGQLCDRVRGKKHWALAAKLKAWHLEREAAAIERMEYRNL